MRNDATIKGPFAITLFWSEGHHGTLTITNEVSGQVVSRAFAWHERHRAVQCFNLLSDLLNFQELVTRSQRQEHAA